MPALIQGMFEDVIVQNEPAAPVYCEHSFVTYSAPAREDPESASAADDPTKSASSTTAADATLEAND